MTYLIMECFPLNDDYECDADREPIAITDDYQKWIKDNSFKGQYEVYTWDGKDMTLVRRWHEHNEEGMAFYYWELGEDVESASPHIIEKYPNLTRKDTIPNKEIEQAINDYCEDGDIDWIPSCGYAAWENDGRWYVYGEYEDEKYSWGF